MSGEKTEAPSERRLQKSREDGRSAISREFSMLASLSAGILAIDWSMSPAGVERWMSASLQHTNFDAGLDFPPLIVALLRAILPPALAASCAYAAATLLQSGFLLHPQALQPNLGRINPLSGVKRLLGPQTLVQLLKSLVKLVVMAACLAVALRRAVPVLPSVPGFSPEALLHRLVTEGRGMVLLLLGAQICVAAIDFGWERFRLLRELRMSFQELKDEHKESEGNPQIKGRMRQLALGRARRRMMQAVPKASVVITNPTHYAVALAYEQGSQGAPRLVAKGADEVAARIRELARTHRVPIIANPPLARALFRVDIDTEIPAEHFRAVAEVIAFVWRMRNRRGRL